ncbi:MAG: hypothetical protein RMH75_06585 [Archaeoglobaceae archaeon]|nr:hypothetical protein [Archaeoglobaceae archaeon]MDW7990309.1 hypothetical protein [Archaeoglobaceae archaeon]
MRKGFIERERNEVMRLPRYTDEEIKKIDEEIRKEIEAGKADFKPRDEMEFKSAEFVSVSADELIYIKPHYRNLRGRRVLSKKGLKLLVLSKIP